MYPIHPALTINQIKLSFQPHIAYYNKFLKIPILLIYLILFLHFFTFVALEDDGRDIVHKGLNVVARHPLEAGVGVEKVDLVILPTNVASLLELIFWLDVTCGARDKGNARVKNKKKNGRKIKKNNMW